MGPATVPALVLISQTKIPSTPRAALKLVNWRLINTLASGGAIKMIYLLLLHRDDGCEGITVIHSGPIAGGSGS